MPEAVRRPGGLPSPGRRGGSWATGKIIGASVPLHRSSGRARQRAADSRRHRTLAGQPAHNHRLDEEEQPGLRYGARAYPWSMDIRVSDKIPGAGVKVRRQALAESSHARPREWLALPDGAIHETQTDGRALALV